MCHWRKDWSNPRKLDELLVERSYLTEMLTRFGGKTELAAEKAGLSLRTLQRKLKYYDLRPEGFK